LDCEVVALIDTWALVDTDRHVSESVTGA